MVGEGYEIASCHSLLNQQNVMVMLPLRASMFFLEALYCL